MYLNTVFKYNVFKYCPALLSTNEVKLLIWKGGMALATQTILFYRASFQVIRFSFLMVKV